MSIQTQYDYKKYKVLFIDDEEKACKYFNRAFEDIFDIITCYSAVEGEKVFEKKHNEIGVIVTDQRMPEITGVQFLDYAFRKSPDVVRILSTAYSDLDAAVDAVNRGQIYKYLTKPWDIAVMEANLRRGMEFFLLKKERDDLYYTKLSSLERLVGLSRMVSFSLAPVFSEHKVSNLNAVMYNFLKLGYMIYDRLDFGYGTIFATESNEKGFYETFRGENYERLKSLVTSTTQLKSKNEAFTEIERILKANIATDQKTLENVDLDILKDVFQGLYGFGATETQFALASEVFPLLASLGQEGLSLSLNPASRNIQLEEIGSKENSLEHFLDDELLLAQIAGSL